jgi:uncharacterized protein (DUF1778 family)
MPGADERVDFRVTPEDKEMLVRAAAAERTSVSSFLRRAARKMAAEVIEREQRITLSNQATEAFMEVVSRPHQPNAALQRALKRADNTVRRD